MAVYAYVLLRCRTGRLKSVVEEIKEMEGVKVVHPVTGRFDAVVEVEVEELRQLTDLVVDRIQAIDGVERTETLISMR